MKIKTQFINSMVIFGIILLIIATSVIVTNQQVERLNNQEEIAKKIERAASELDLLSNDYLIYHESQQHARWESKFSELSDYLSNLKPNSPEQQALVNNIRANQQRLKAVFTDVVSTFENTSQGAVADPVFQIAWSRMAIQNQGMAFDAERLAQTLRDQAHQLEQTNIILIFALLGIFGAYFLTNYLIVYRRALKSISDLQAGTTIIGSGNLDYSIKTNRQDEIGELSRAFNQMTASLKDVTASKAELEREITERKRAENALRESEQRWSTTLASIGDAVIATDANGRITFMNAVAEALTGWTLAEASTKPVKEVFNIINEDTRAEVEDPVTKVLTEGMIVGLANHTVLVRKDGSEVPIDDSGAPIRDANGKTMGVVLVFRDITERKQAEKQIEHLASFPQLNPNPVIEIDANGTVTFSNAATGEVLKTLESEDDAHNFLPDDFEEIMKALEQEKEIQTFYREVGVKDRIFGESIHIIKKRSVARIYVHDITDRKRAEDDIKCNEARLESLLMISQHRAGSIQELLDFSLDEAVALTGSKIGYIYHYDETRKEFTLNTWSKDVMKQCTIAEPQTIYQLEKTGIWGEAVRQARPIIVNDFQAPHPLKKGYPDGHAPLYKYMTVPVFSDSHIVGVVGVANKETDYDIADVRQLTLLMDSVWKITERKRAEEALRTSNQQLDLLSYTAGKLLTSDKPQQVVEELCKRVLSSLDCSTFFNYLVDEDKQCLHLNACAGIPEETAREIEWLDYGVAVCGCAARDGCRIVCENIPGTFDPRTELVRSFGIKAYACHPLFSQGRVIGTLSFGTRSRLSFTDDELALMKTVSEHVAIAMERERAHDELERQVKERTAELEEANKALLAEIAERRRAEGQIREQAALLDKAQDAIGVRDLEHRIIYLNKSAQRLYGWTSEEMIGKNADKLLYKKESPQLIEAKKSVIEKGEWTGELRQVTKDGKDIIVEGHWTLVHDNEGKPKSILIINTDVTEKKKLESQLLRAQRMESIGTLAGGIAHDLNNVLTPIMLSLQMLKEKIKDEQGQKLLGIVETNSQRGANLIKQVLSFARGVEGERNPLQVKHIISEIERIAKETFPRNIEIRINIANDLWTVSGDATQLHQVIMNLCVNARDAMPYGGKLDISAENFFIDKNYTRMNPDAKVGQYLVIAVSDIGTGIPPEILDRIFEPFFTTKEHGKGTGLGLSTALAIIKSHGGFINTYSEVGKGTTFRVYLPAVKTELQNAEEPQLEMLIGHGELILVVEDEASISEITCSTLHAYGYRAITAVDGAEAVALYAQNKDKVKVVLMDMMMPVMDGQESIRVIRRVNPEVKIIAVSGLAEKDKLDRIADVRVHAFLPKPYTAERLLKTIDEVITKTL